MTFWIRKWLNAERQMDFIQSRSGGLVMAISWLVAYLGALLWARHPQHRDRWLVMIAATAMGAIVFLANQVARARGWWDWWGYSLPFTVQLSLLLLGPSIFFIVILTGYRLLVAHSHHPRRIYGLVMIAILVPLTVLGDIYGLQQGTLSFGGGYTILQDVLLGQAFAWLPIGLYEVVNQLAVKQHWRT